MDTYYIYRNFFWRQPMVHGTSTYSGLGDAHEFLVQSPLRYCQIHHFGRPINLEFYSHMHMLHYYAFSPFSCFILCDKAMYPIKYTSVTTVIEFDDWKKKQLRMIWLTLQHVEDCFCTQHKHTIEWELKYKTQWEI